MRKVHGHGPDQADIVIVGEAPGADEEVQGKPFVGNSGFELRKMLREVGIRPDRCYMTNVAKYRPPGNELKAWWTHEKKKAEKQGLLHQRDGFYHNDMIAEGIDELHADIVFHNPKIVIGLGNAALWALTGEHGIMGWRGSEMVLDIGGRSIPFVPTFHPAAILRKWDWRAQAITDLEKRVVRRLNTGFPGMPAYRFNIDPTFDEVIDRLTWLLRTGGPVAADIETTRNRIACIGFAWSPLDALCIPFFDLNGVRWDRDQEARIIQLIGQLNDNPHLDLIGQNFSVYDAVVMEELWGIRLRPDFDTMIAQSVAYPGVPRSLGFLSSMYCDWHCYWKEDNKDWNNIKDFPSLFQYNCRDCCATWEAAAALRKVLERANLLRQFAERMAYSRNVYDMGQRGMVRNEQEIDRLDAEIEEALQDRAVRVAEKAGHPVNPLSPLQVQKLFYTELECRKIANRKSAVANALSTDDEALKTIIKRHPEVADIALAILESRSLSSIRSNFIRSKLDPDGRLRSSFGPTGTTTFRLTSGKTALGRGTNLLNITDGEHVHSGRPLPNLRKCIVPDPDNTLFEIDLKKADVWIVAYEASDARLKQMLRDGVDLHRESARTIFDMRDDAPVTEQQYAFGKVFRHLTNYGGTARTAAIQCGCTVHQADMGQKRLFMQHPGIPTWHKRIKEQLITTRTVTNPFGYRIVYFGRPEELFGEGLSWTPQSTIALLTSLIHMEIDRRIPDVQILLQVYDSLMGQYPTHLEHLILPQLQAASRIAVPYSEPLFIPMELKTSTVSWGDCEKRAWPTTEQSLLQRIG